MPVVELEPAARGAPVGGASGRVFRGALYFGHANCEWLLGHILLVQQAQAHIPRGQYLFELIHPQDKQGAPVTSPTGKYLVKLWIGGGWRAVAIDDRVPLDLFGRPLVVASRPPQLWPVLLSKALFKVMATYRILERTSIHQARSRSRASVQPTTSRYIAARVKHRTEGSSSEHGRPRPASLRRSIPVYRRPGCLFATAQSMYTASLQPRRLQRFTS